MTSRRRKPRMAHLALLAISAAALVSVVPGPSSAEPTETTATAATNRVAAVAHGTVVLPTGDRVLPGGGVVSPSGKAASYLHLRAGSHDFEVPTAAVSRLGHGVDPSLFDVTALAAVERDGVVPIEVTGSAPVSKIAGAERVGPAGSRRGTLDAAGQRRFAAALVSGRAVPSGNTVALAGRVPVATRSTAGYHVLTIKATNAKGAPENNGFAVVYDVDDPARLGANLSGLVILSHGVGKISVPDGHFATWSASTSTDAEGNDTALHITTRPQLTVTADKSIALDARKATGRVDATTPKPSQLQQAGFAWLRTDAAKDPSTALYVDQTEAPGVPVFVEPQPRATLLGAQYDYSYQRRTSPPGPGLPYEYDLTGPVATNSIASGQRVTVTAENVARVDAKYYSDISSLGFTAIAATQPFEYANAVTVRRPVSAIALPTERIEYRSAGTPAWSTVMSKATDTDFGALLDAQSQTDHRYAGGERVNLDINRYPLRPAPYATPDANTFPLPPGADRAGDSVGFTLLPWSGTGPDSRGDFGYADSGEGITKSGSYRLAADGKTIASGSVRDEGFGDFGPFPGLPATASTLSFSLSNRSSGEKQVLAKDNDTTWTWRSAHESGSTVPVGTFYCNTAAPADAVTNHCRVEPLLTSDYAVHGQRLDGTTYFGTQTVDIAIGHLPGAVASAVTGLTASYSTDGGSTWTKATVTGKGGAYSASFPVYSGSPEPVDRFVDLRIAAKDAAGGSISQTITRALRVVVNPND